MKDNLPLHEPNLWGRLTYPYTQVEDVIYGFIWAGIIVTAVAHFLLHWF